jgi:hypothetical protein
VTNPTAEMLAAELRDHPPILLDLDAPTALALAGVLQLALRHPRLDGAIAGQMATLVDRIAAALGPVAGMVVALGWDPGHDV